MSQHLSAGDRATQALFEAPSIAFQPAAYWFWHSIPDTRTSSRQLTDFKARGISTIYVQARLSMPRQDYLSDAFIAAYRDAMEIAAELGMSAGIYDDYNWISGQAAGRTVKGRDGLRERHLFWSQGSQRGGAITGIRVPWAAGMSAHILEWQYEGGEPAWCDWTLEAALLHPAVNLARPEQITDVTHLTKIVEAGEQSCRFEFARDVPDGFILTVFLSARSLTSHLINYLLPEAAESFIERGLEPLVTALDGLIPDPVSHIFYDQPAPGFYRWDQLTGNLENSLPFSSSLAAAIESRTGLPLGTALLALVIDIGPRTPIVRARLYAAVSELTNSAFFGTLRQWAQQRGLAMTGHEILPHVGSWSLNGGFSGIDPRIAPAVDFFGIDSFRDMTAADANNFSAQLAPKLADSVARANGRSRCIVETYATALRSPVRAAGQWELTLETMRAHAIRLHCLGMRQSIWHGLYQTDGRDDDPTPFVNPRFDFPPGLNFEPWWFVHDLFASETARLSAFMEPGRPLMRVAILYPLHTAWSEGPRHLHASHVGLWSEALLKNRTDFLFVSEEALSTAQLHPDGIEISGQVFEAVVLPAVSVMESRPAIDVLNRFASIGGHVWSSGEIERILLVEEDGCAPSPAATQLGKAPMHADVLELVRTLGDKGPRIGAENAQPMWRWIGEDEDGGWRIVLFNDGNAVACEHIALAGGFRVEVWSCDTGEIAAQPACAELIVVLNPQELRCLRLRPAIPEQQSLTLPPQLTVSTNDDGVIILDGNWEMRFSDTEDTYMITVDRGWHEQGFATRSGTGIYRRIIEFTEPGAWSLELPSVHTAATVSIDGRVVGRRAWSPYCFSLGKLKAGTHLLEISVSSTAANRYYAGTPYQGDQIDPCGLSSAPRLIRLER
ncbi:carbohydrate-binding protein [Rhizobium sp. NPDC090279]|uniref:carbohydrate-binding protein n=1 Tax=Rhizobium sp. NPDC090279 TaxID=3364499 RepID=UPI00383A4BC6